MDSSGNYKESNRYSTVSRSNGRKRKIPCSDAKDIECEIPSKRLASNVSPTSSQSSLSQLSSSTADTTIVPSFINDHISETQSSSECYSTTTDFDIGHLGSPGSESVLSPLDSASNGWNMKGDTTPHGIKKKIKTEQSYLSTTCSLTHSSELRVSPMPNLPFADSNELFKTMCRKDDKASLLRNPSMLNAHPALHSRMRSILLDWLSEVCEVYKLHRETYYLAIDYLDRFLNKYENVAKTHLQLIGITCLFIAAKVEEIYPPKIGEFAYVTDGACSEDDILREELIILQTIDWEINSLTVMGFLELYMQLNVKNFQPNFNKTKPSLITEKLVRNTKHVEGFIFPQFSSLEFCHTAQLIDLCALDIEMANFRYSLIAAAAISHTMNRETATRVSGYEWKEILPCYKWMEPYFQIIKEDDTPIFLLEHNEQIDSKFGVGHISPNIVTDDSYITQVHTTSLELFDRACARREQMKQEELIIKEEASPAQLIKNTCTAGLLTPPATIRKPIDNHSNVEVDQENLNDINFTTLT